MKRNVLDPEVKDLPPRLAVFPLAAALLLPGGRLPLNILSRAIWRWWRMRWHHRIGSLV